MASRRSTANANAAKAAKAAATTPCPRCGTPIVVLGERGACPSCAMPVRFVDAQERPCIRCRKPVACPPGAAAVRCLACDAWNAADPTRPVEGRAKCPRCGRRVAVPPDAAQAPCPRCGTSLSLEDA